MSDENIGVMVEFQAKYDTVTTGFNQIAKGSQNVIDANKKVDASFTDLTSHATAGADTILNKWLGLGVALSAGGLVAFFNKTADAIEHVTDTARGLGISGGDFQKLSYAAELGGVSMDDLAGSLKKFNITLGQASSGNADAIQNFKNLGINIDDIKGKDLTTQFLTTASAAAKLGNSNVAAADSMALFGRNYTSALSLGRDGIEQNIKGFDELGVSLTESQRTAVRAFDDSKTKLDTIFDGFFQKVVADVSPAFTALITQVTDFIQKSGGIDGLATTVADRIKTIIEGATTAFTFIYDKVSYILDKLQGINTGKSSDATINDPNASYVSKAGALFDVGFTGLENLLTPISRNIADAAIALKTGEREPSVGSNLGSLLGAGASTWSQVLSGGGLQGNALTDLIGNVGASNYTGYDPNRGVSAGSSSIPNYLTGSTVTTPPPGLTDAATAALTAGLTSSTKGLQDWTQALYKSSDMITGMFASIDSKNKSDTLNEISGIISDKGLVNPYTRTTTGFKDDPNDPTKYAEDKDGNLIEEKQNVYQKATGTDFESHAADLIAGIKTGQFGGQDITSQLNGLRNDAANNASAGLDNSGEVGIIDEIKKFAESMGAITAKPIQVQVSIAPTKDFIAKVMQDPDNKSYYYDVIDDYSTQQAQTGANT